MTKKVYRKVPGNSLGCGLEVGLHTQTGYVCGLEDGWGKEHLCPKCNKKLRDKWRKEDKENGRII